MFYLGVVSASVPPKYACFVFHVIYPLLDCANLMDSSCLCVSSWWQNMSVVGGFFYYIRMFNCITTTMPQTPWFCFLMFVLYPYFGSHMEKVAWLLLETCYTSHILIRSFECFSHYCYHQQFCQMIQFSLLCCILSCMPRRYCLNLLICKSQHFQCPLCNYGVPNRNIMLYLFNTLSLNSSACSFATKPFDLSIDVISSKILLRIILAWIQAEKQQRILNILLFAVNNLRYSGLHFDMLAPDG